MTDETKKDRALVLGGGGVTGVAWELGILAGLAEAGVDPTAADVLLGTSAGSVVAALVATGTPLEDAFASQLEPSSTERAASLGAGILLRLLWATWRSSTPEEFGKRAGRMALDAHTLPESDRLAVIAARLPVHEWPDKALWITAVDALSGAFRVLDRESGVPIVDAVAASCAVPGVWPPVTLQGRRYIDGGMRTATNLTVAKGYARVLVIAPLTRGFRSSHGVHSEARVLEAQGSRVLVLSPDAAALEAIGRNVLDPAKRGPAARAGRAQAAAVASAVRDLWNAPAS